MERRDAFLDALTEWLSDHTDRPWRGAVNAAEAAVEELEKQDPEMWRRV